MAETLMVGQVVDLAAPTGGGAELYWLNPDSYGASTGDDVPLRIETPDIAPAGAAGEGLARRLMIPIRYAGACQIRVTVTADFIREVAQVTQSYAAPPAEQQDILVVKLAQRCTAIRALIEVVSRSGRVQPGQPTLLTRPRTAAAAQVVETT